MENASKALIIAGAILLSILIIALGMRIYNSASSSAANADLSAQEIASFNSTFEAYEGVQKGTAVRQLITAINNSNVKNTDKTIQIIGGENVDSAVSQTSITSNVTYTVSFTYDSATGLITACTISK